MYGNSWTLALAPALLVALFLSPSSASTVCNASLYGSPNPIDCLRILLDDHKAGTYGLESIDGKDHFFYTKGFDQRPSDVTRTQWRNKVHLAQTSHRGGCSVFLAVGFDAKGVLSYDKGKFLSIARPASKVQAYCSHSPELGDGVPTMEGGQGWAGERGRILTILYSNTSAFAEMLAADHNVEGMLPDLKAISAQNPPTVPDAEPWCGTTQHCSGSRDCRREFGCVCIAEKWHGEFYTGTCRLPFSGNRNGRGLLGTDLANATESSFSMNSTLTGEGTMDLACPCNCTYVSRACCNSLTGIVYEAPNLRLGSVQAPSVNLTCNATTGEFQASNMTLDVILTRERGHEQRAQ